MKGQIYGKSAHTIIIDEPLPEHANCRCDVSRLFKEEQSAFRAARVLFRTGPRRVMTNHQGQADPWGSVKAGIGVKGAPNVAKALATHHPYIFIRDDGWTLAASRNLKGIAEDEWKGQWIGVIHVKRPTKEGRIISELTVIPDNGTEYIAGHLDEEGKPFDLGDLRKDDQEHVKQIDTEPTTIDDLREWIKAGCHTE